MNTGSSKSPPGESQQTQYSPATSAPDIQGEGNYEAARRYDKAASDFAHSGKVDEAAQAARPRDIKEADEMERSERMGKARSKGDLKDDLAGTDDAAAARQAAIERSAPT